MSQARDVRFTWPFAGRYPVAVVVEDDVAYYNERCFMDLPRETRVYRDLNVLRVTFLGDPVYFVRPGEGTALLDFFCVSEIDV